MDSQNIFNDYQQISKDFNEFQQESSHDKTVIGCRGEFDELPRERNGPPWDLKSMSLGINCVQAPVSEWGQMYPLTDFQRNSLDPKRISMDILKNSNSSIAVAHPLGLLGISMGSTLLQCMTEELYRVPSDSYGSPTMAVNFLRCIQQ